MKVYLSNYRNHWISPYTILKTVCFWEKDEDVFYDLDDTGKGKYVRLVNFLNPICSAWQKFLDVVHPEIRYVKIDRYDTWSMDHTLAPIILPMLKQLRDTAHGSANVDLEDVPEELRTTTHHDYDAQSCFEFYHDDEQKDGIGDVHARWKWVLNEMIFAFEHLIDDTWQDEFKTGEYDMKSVPCDWDENGKPTLYTFEKGPNHTHECDWEAIFAIEKRMQKGFELFGKYYRNLWD